MRRGGDGGGAEKEGEKRGEMREDLVWVNSWKEQKEPTEKSNQFNKNNK